MVIVIVVWKSLKDNLNNQCSINFTKQLQIKGNQLSALHNAALLAAERIKIHSVAVEALELN